MVGVRHTGAADPSGGGEGGRKKKRRDGYSWPWGRERYGRFLRDRGKERRFQQEERGERKKAKATIVGTRKPTQPDNERKGEGEKRGGPLFASAW